MADGLRVFLTEDNDNPHVMSAVLNAHGITIGQPSRQPGSRVTTLVGQMDGLEKVHIKVVVKNGITDLLDTFAVECKSSNVASVAGIVDANGNFNGRWQDIQRRLNAAGCTNIPSVLPRDGLTSAIPEGPLVGVWIMPDNGSSGMLEDFMRSLIKPTDPLLPLVESFIDSIPDGIRPFGATKRTKVIIHTWLALQEIPGRPQGQAITFKYFNPMTPTCAAFATWLRRMLIGSETSHP